WWLGRRRPRRRSIWRPGGWWPGRWSETRWRTVAGTGRVVLRRIAGRGLVSFTALEDCHANKPADGRRTYRHQRKEAPDDQGGEISVALCEGSPALEHLASLSLGLLIGGHP